MDRFIIHISKLRRLPAGLTLVLLLTLASLALVAAQLQAETRHVATGLPDAAGEGMASDSRPLASDLPCIVAPVVGQTSQSGRRLAAFDPDGATARETSNDIVVFRTVVATISIVSSRLGQQATLVGAKPSGTG